MEWVPGRPMSCAYRRAEYLRGKGEEGREIEAVAAEGDRQRLELSIGIDREEICR